MRVQFLGAAKQVGGSCQLFEVDDLKILIDVGLVQKNDIRSDMIFNTKEFTFNPKEIDYVILTHAHIDHIGLIPALVKAGYSGPILCTEPTMKISEISLKDCAFIWQREIEKALEMFSASPKNYYSLIFMDIRMPEKSGCSNFLEKH